MTTAGEIMGMAGNAVAGIGVLIQAEQDAQFAETNAESARNDARLSILAASVRVEDIRRDADEFKGTQAAVAAANGVVSTEGSPLDLMIKTAGAAERAAQREMFSGEVQAARYITEANIYKRQAQNIRITGMIQHVATTLGGATFDRGTNTGPRPTGTPFDTGGQTQTRAYQDYRAGERANYAGGGSSSAVFGSDLL